MARFNQMINFGSSEVPIPSQESLFWRCSAQSQTHDDEAGERGLNLCLSLGGVYAREEEKPPPPPQLLVRSSSVAGDAAAAAGERPFLSLARSCSLPAEASEEDEAARVRRRMAAKRRVAEKQRASAEVAAWAAASAAKSAALGRAISRIKTQNCPLVEGQEFLAATNDSADFKPFPEQRDGMGPQADSELHQNPLKKVRASCGRVLNSWADGMPSVTTTGDGPNGKRVEGFLYKYTKGQVSIVCVCHGSFLSPAEFVRHAGGKEVANPMRHINVCTALPS